MKQLINAHVPLPAILTAIATFVYSSDIAYGGMPVADSTNEKAAVVRGTIHWTKGAELSSANSGVSLIELIKQRIRSLPQLAVTNAKQTIAFQQQETRLGQFLFAADPHLLIKPQVRQETTDAAPCKRMSRVLPTAQVQSVVSKAPLVKDFNIALIPPTVVSGIAAVGLGNSTKEARQSISALGQISKQKLNDWTVWSVYKTKTKVNESAGMEDDTNECREPLGSCRLQIFIQAGMVEAIRVFDASLMRGNLGVTLGDDLSLIKGKFGEPAFILAEPNLRVSQNYIYPINQIGFQLERQKNEAVPRIVSILIFNAR